ncbi:DUF6464 family protein [Oscillatoria sp. FACHB-1406]|uniref:DUF6464 family protein n=1 Tax=Oscillatoria sp. FACHB-1406 TaxID=2692846 RepID=UPI0016889C8D|nr:DUF6464 family protein [Oscillatoria sp. FACHB-1406]MBD2580316.1 hypothetical protein [Oscillatoria sp. FACHB-1406]
MEPVSLPTELISTETHRSLGKIDLDWMPQPGNYLDVEGKTYAVLERHHHYQYRIGGYFLKKISLHVKNAQRPSERSLIEGRWVIGDASCRYNARSEMLRCAINPEGPCANCRFYEAE